MLTLQNITKTYKSNSYKITALDNISLSFQDKGMIFITGKSGSGKSTLLNIIGGLDSADDGNIIINGRSMKDFSNKEFDAYRNFNIGFIFQEFNLIDDLTVKENIAVALKIQSKNHDLTTIDEALKIVGLEGLGYRNIKELSGGQKQRVAIARALIKNPNIILADEPTGALDSKTSYDLMSSLKTLSLNKLVIVVTHDDEYAYEFADEIITLNDGHIVSHLVLKDEYKEIKNEKISNNILKVVSGNAIDNVDDINSMLKKNDDNYVCLLDNPELVTTAFPNDYEKVFKKQDLQDKYYQKQDVDNVENINIETSKLQKSHISYKECFKMALNQYKNRKGKVGSLLIFAIIAIFIIGISYCLLFVDNSRVVANTLINNDISLAMMEKYDKNGKVILDNTDLDNLKDNNSDVNFALAKETPFVYKASNQKSNSDFEMNYFTGIVECNNLVDLNLKAVAGKLSFDDNSLNNHEIIISDYAAFELRRTGYLGYDKDYNYGLIQPDSLENQINSYVTINDVDYKIIGVFDTNYEKYLPLLISETYVEKQDDKSSSLNALKSYYYSRIFAPIGFYKKYINENVNLESINNFAFDCKDIPLYKYDSETDTIQDSIDKLVDLKYNNFSSFYSFEDIKDSFSYTTIWGQVPQELSNNQVILSYDWLNQFEFENRSQIDAAINKINQNGLICRYEANGQLGSILYDDGIEVVAVIDIDNTIIDNHELVYRYYKDIAIMFSDSLKEKLDSTTYSYDQIFFTLDGNLNSYIISIKKMEKQDYSVINMNGEVSYSNSSIEAIKSVAYVASIIMLIFILLIMTLFVSGSIKDRKREIGILKAVGARTSDIFRIYLVEEGILALIIIIVSLVLVKYGTNLINYNFADTKLSMQLVNFDILTVLVIVLLTIILFVVSTFIPVYKIARMKPVEAIRKL